jgi:hypothetical protein
MSHVPLLHPALQIAGQLVQTPPWQRLLPPHPMHSLIGVCVQLMVPLHACVMQAVGEQVTAVPMPHVPADEHVSP